MQDIPCTSQLTKTFGLKHPASHVELLLHMLLKNDFGSLHSVKTILGTSIGVGCSNQMQVAQEQLQDLQLIKVVPLCKLHLVAASCSYSC